MNSRPTEAVLLTLDLGVGYKEPVKDILERFPDAVFSVILDSCAPDSVVKEFQNREIIRYHPAMPLRDKLRLLIGLRNRRFDRAYFIGRYSDLRQLGVIWFTGAGNRIFAQIGASPEGHLERKIGLPGLCLAAVCRGILFAALLPAVVCLRLLFVWEKYGKKPTVVPPPPFSNFPLYPGVSVVIPNYNGRELLEECLPSVIRAARSYGERTEIILVDDASTDGSAGWVKERFPEVRVEALPHNVGFGRASHHGIARASHDLVMLLNSDIAVTETFLFPLVRCFFKYPGLFAVQPRAYYPGGKRLNVGLNVGRLDPGTGYLQIWNEADTEETERIDRPCPTLYCLGGAMLFDRRKYLELGGFDSLFYPFRWEDIDLCYRAWKRGWRLLYQPESVVYHKHHATLNKVFSPDYLNIIEQKNELLFIWKNLHDAPLIGRHFTKLPRYLLSRLVSGRYNFCRGLLRALVQLPFCLGRRRVERIRAVKKDSQVLGKSLRIYRNFLRGDETLGKGRKRQVLILNPVFPYPPVDGGKIRLYNLLREASKTNDIHLLCFIQKDQEQYLPHLRKICRYVDTAAFPPPPAPLGAFQRALFPMYYRGFYSEEMRAKLAGILRARPLDIVQMEFDKMLYWVRFVRDLPTVYVEHDVASLFLRGGKNPPLKGWRRLIDIYEWMRTLRWEVVIGSQFTRIATVSPRDREILRDLLPAAAISAGRTGTSLKQFYKRYEKINSPSLLYIGSFIHYPNAEAILYFRKKIWPLIKENIPGATLTVVGSHPTPEITALSNDPSIKVAGFVEDVRPYLDSSAVFIAPMRKGYGMKGKILEAMARAKPVVTTSLGMRGIRVVPGRHLLIGDTPEEFAGAVVHLLNDDGLRSEIARAGQRLVESEYDWGVVAREMDAVYEEILDGEVGESETEAKDFVELVRGFLKEGEKDCAPPESLQPIKELNIELTYRCNQKCIMCNIWKRCLKEPELVKRELRPDEIRDLVMGSGYLRNLEVAVLSGGEPFLRPDLPEVCGLFLENFPGLQIGILTNLNNPELIIRTLRRIEERWGTSRLWLGSSLDGIGETHDRIRGCPGAFNSLNLSVEMIRKEFPRLPLSLSFIMTPVNYKDLLPAFHFASGLGADFSAQFPIPWEGTTTFTWKEEELRELEKAVYTIIQYFIDDAGRVAGKEGLRRDKGLFSRVFYWQGLIEYGKNPRRLFPRCKAGDESVMFSPQGDLYFCPRFKNETIGNVREKKFDDLWESAEMNGFRERNFRRECHCWLNCMVYSFADRALRKA